MHPFVIVMHLAGAVMLLLWALRMVRTGVERAHGHALKRALRGTRVKRFGSAAAGAILAVVLQSPTAVGILAAGFATNGILSVGTGIAALLGWDFGSALVVKILSFDLSGLIPILLFIGATVFLKSERRTIRHSGRIVLGIAFILLSLKMVSEATEPLRDSSVLPQIVGYLRDDLLSAFALAAILAWMVHSSVATVLLFISFAGMGMLPLVRFDGLQCSGWVRYAKSAMGRSRLGAIGPSFPDLFRSVFAGKLNSESALDVSFGLRVDDLRAAAVHVALSLGRPAKSALSCRS